MYLLTFTPVLSSQGVARKVCPHISFYWHFLVYFIVNHHIIEVNLKYSNNMILSTSNQMKIDIYWSKNTDWDELKCKNIV